MKTINNSAPVKCSRTILIHARSEKVWEVLTDINNWTSWQSGISKSSLNGSLLPKTTFDWKSEGINIHSTLHTVEPFKKLGWTGKAMGTFAIHNWTLTESKGQTSVKVEESMEGFLVGLFKRSFNKNLEKGMDKWLDLLKKECER